MAAQQGMDHPHVMSILGAGCSPFCSNGEEQGDAYYIVSELAANGEVFDYVDECQGLDDRQTRQVFG
jgi:hypothetical protein